MRMERPSVIRMVLLAWLEFWASARARLVEYEHVVDSAKGR